MDVFIADDHDLVIDGFKRIFEETAIDVVGCCLNGKELLKWLHLNSADVVVLDIEMPEMGGIEVLEYLKKHNLRHRIVVLSGFLDYGLLEAIMDLGVMGYVTKNDLAVNIVDAVEAVGNDSWYFSNEVRAMLELVGFEKNTRSKKAREMLNKTLTKREMNIINAIVNEVPTVEIAEDMKTTESTVRSRTEVIRNKIGVKNNVGLAMRFAFLREK
ncbi:two-component system nitrate/nitrite response regulator NarL/two-component system capsular synthesis response regulator RcsB [Lutibacter sp. Hel_I_33_5]|uniref:response regulator transcription factor n=1 Tax=Lutibacter sp. Hel_I_33_5 TaxID=1566289 RepID=UPI00119D8F3E|nr:response regulator transcription factor [Lutibacter sp. Hel_I_33_5]TVZ55634.1 two-component system nitrate/nitrite response regulator NarL/two-component system capsular synthesis response regulator RcsB [Lutibacter sp. Hel_I_33_5]